MASVDKDAACADVKDAACAEVSATIKAVESALAWPVVKAAISRVSSTETCNVLKLLSWSEPNARICAVVSA